MTANFLADFLYLLFTFICIALVWPKVIFWKFLKNKKIWYQVFFNISITIVIINLFINVLGIFNILNPLIVQIMFYGSFIFSICIYSYKYMHKNWNNDDKSIINKITKIFKSSYQKRINDLKSKFKSFVSFDSIVNTLINIFIIIVIFIFAFHFGEYARTKGVYGFSDLPRHEEWIKQLFDGQFCKDGAYPFGMHFFIYVINIIFNVRVSIQLLYLGTIMCVLFFIAFYCWLMEIFNNKLSVAIVFLMALVSILFIWHYEPAYRMVYDGLHRFQWTLPQEFVLYSVFVSPLCLIRLLNSDKKINDKSNRHYLILFSVLITTTLCTHFYTTLFQFVFCLSIAIVYINKFNGKKFLYILLSVVFGCLLAIIPLFFVWLKVGTISYPIQWGVGVTSGQSQVFEEIASVVPKESFNPFITIYQSTIIPLFKDGWAIVSLLLILFGFLITCLNFFKNRKRFCLYLSVIISMLILYCLFAAPVLHISRLLESYRIVICLYYTCLTVMCFPIDYFINLLCRQTGFNSFPINCSTKIF